MNDDQGIDQTRWSSCNVALCQAGTVNASEPPSISTSLGENSRTAFIVTSELTQVEPTCETSGPWP